jgi:hypothetical protein
MNPPDTSDSLDVLLREQNAYIDDKGFTARDIAGLPPRRRRAWLRPVVLLGATAIGYFFALCWMPWSLLNPSVLLSFNAQALFAYGLLLAIGGSLVWGVIAALGWEE